MQFVNFCSDLMYVLPGQNNQVYGEKVFKQNHYLMWTIRELTSLMQDSSDDSINNIKFSTLYRFIKLNKQFTYQRDIPRNTCLCPICENTTLFCEAVNKVNDTISVPLNCHLLLNAVTCNPMKKICAQELCSECPDANFDDIHCINIITYYTWKKISGRSYPEKVLVVVQKPMTK